MNPTRPTPAESSAFVRGQTNAAYAALVLVFVLWEHLEWQFRLVLLGGALFALWNVYVYKRKAAETEHTTREKENIEQEHQAQLQRDSWRASHPCEYWIHRKLDARGDQAKKILRSLNKFGIESEKDLDEDNWSEDEWDTMRRFLEQEGVKPMMIKNVGRHLGMTSRSRHRSPSPSPRWNFT